MPKIDGRINILNCLLVGPTILFVVNLVGVWGVAVAAPSVAQELQPSGESFELQIGSAMAPEHIKLVVDGVTVLHSPANQLWSIAMDWHDRWPTEWYHAVPDQVDQVGAWTILKGTVTTPEGAWDVSDAYRREGDVVRCKRRFQWRGEQAAERCTLSVRYLVPGTGQGIVMPGVLYHGNPSGAKSGRVPVYTGLAGEEAFFEEHRFPMPFASIEWLAGSTWLGAAIHTLPSPTPFGHRADQWWSLGCKASLSGTELALLSGPCAANGTRSSIKMRQSAFGDYDEAFLTVPPDAIIEKTFVLQAYPVKAEGSGFQTAVQTSLSIFRPGNPQEFPTIAEILAAKSRFAMTRWHDDGNVAGFRKYPPGRPPVFVIGWCGQAVAPGYALQVLGQQFGIRNGDKIAQRSLDTISGAKFYDGGFHTWYDYEKKLWSHVEVLAQGQGMNNMALAVRVGRQRGLDTGKWEKFLRHACDVHMQRISQDDWSPVSTNEAFFIAPLCKASRLFEQPEYLAAACTAADTYGRRQVNMREPYWGGTLDASCEDKEGAYAALQGFLAVYEATGEKKYLEWAQHALDLVLSYVYVWDVDMPAGRLRDHGFKTRGWTAVSVQNMHIDVYGVLMVPEIYRMGQLLGRENLKQLALLMYRSCGQLLDPYGSQGEQPQQTNYAQGGDLHDPANFRGGYHETWTVFWITAHFLNAAAQLQEMGIEL